IKSPPDWYLEVFFVINYLHLKRNDSWVLLEMVSRLPNIGEIGSQAFAICVTASRKNLDDIREEIELCNRYSLLH
ncbi:MAG: hypothetical protein AAFO95_03800, partial [Cyanobacteria bacterium J06600_6]